MDLVLTPEEVRVLGSLLEKERTVPVTYPLTTKALVAACNQTSSRDPLMHLDEAAVEAAVESLKAHRLVRRVLPSHGSRTVKHRQVASEVLALDDAQRAVLTVLLLRGPQTPQELKARTERLHPFADAAEVEATLEDMARWGDPLVRLLPRRRGQRDARWAHLLAGDPEAGWGDDDAPGATPAPGAAPGGAPPPTTTATTGPAPTATPADPGAPAPAADPGVHGVLAALAGTWSGPGEGHYPTIRPFGYTERIDLVPVPGKPMLSYRSATRAADDGRGLHAESGFLRLVAPDEVELVVATGPGVVEVCTGVVEVGDGVTEVVLASQLVAGTPTAKEVTATERALRVEGDVLSYDLSMAAVGQPLTHHLRARLQRG